MPKLKAPSRDSQSKKKSAATKKHSKPAPPPSSFKSAEYVHESDQEEPEVSEKEDGSSPSKSTDVVDSPNGKLQRPTGSSSSSENENESDENGSEADAEKEEEEEENESSDAAKETVAEPAKQVTSHLSSNALAYTSRNSSKAHSATVVTFQKPAPYTPPVGFEKASLSGTQKTAQMFKKSSLEGKQIWYFTAPASLSISLIEQMSLKDITTGKAIISHQGKDYGFTPDSTGDKLYTKIMAPHASGDGYRTTKKPIEQIFHLQHIINLPGVQRSAKKPIRQQPQGLRMRFRPIGFGDGETGQIGSSSSSVDGSTASVSEEETEAAPQPFRQPVPVASDSSDADESSDESDSEKESSSSDVEMAEAPPLQIEPPARKRKDPGSTQVSSLQKPPNGSLKRKHDRKEERRPKHSSSRSSSIDNRELKRVKQHQTESQKSLEERASVSTELQKSSIKIPPTKAHMSASKKNTLIRPPEPTIPSKASQMPLTHASEKTKSKKRDCSEPATPARKSGLSLQDLTKATDPSLTGEERKKKIKKLKRKE